VSTLQGRHQAFIARNLFHLVEAADCPTNAVARFIEQKHGVLCLSWLIIITSSASPEGGRDAGLQVHPERRARFRASSTLRLSSNLPFESTSLGNFVLQPYQLLSSKMAPKCPGGRPRNEWNSSRSRKLVRLYTLTRLSKEDIQKVLALKTLILGESST
jgi:hypothetical protein